MLIYDSVMLAILLCLDFNTITTKLSLVLIVAEDHRIYLV